MTLAFELLGRERLVCLPGMDSTPHARTHHALPASHDGSAPASSCREHIQYNAVARQTANDTLTCCHVLFRDACQRDPSQPWVP